MSNINREQLEAVLCEARALLTERLGESAYQAFVSIGVRGVYGASIWSTIPKDRLPTYLRELADGFDAGKGKKLEI